MAKKDTQRKIAEGMFIEQGMTAKAIAELLDVSEKSVSAWRKLDNWDARKDEATAAPHKIRELLLKELKILSEGGESKLNADGISKISKVLESLSDRISVQVIISVFKEFDMWMTDEDPVQALKFTEYHRKFILHKINSDG